MHLWYQKNNNYATVWVIYTSKTVPQHGQTVSEAETSASQLGQ